MTTADPYAEFSDAPPAAAPAADPYAEFSDAPPANYDAALFQQRVGRTPSAPELSNFQQTKGVGWANDPGASPAAGVSAVNDAGTGFGIGINSSEMGVHQIALHIGQHLGLVKPEDVAAYDAQIKQQQQQDAPTLNTTAGMVGNAAEKVGEFAAGGELLAPLKGAALANDAVQASRVARFAVPVAADAATGAAVSGAQPVVGGESRLTNAATGAALNAAGGLIGKGVGRLFAPAADDAGAAAQRLANADAVSPAGVQYDPAGVAINSVREGVPINAAQAGAPLAKAMRQVASLGFGGENTAPAMQGFTRAALRTVGADSNVADQATLDAAGKRIGGVMDDIHARNNVTFDSTLEDRLSQIESENSALLSGTDAGGQLRNQLGNILGKVQQDGTIPGNVFQQLRTNAGELSGDSTNGTLRRLSGQLTQALDEAQGRTLSPEDASALKQARLQYGRLQVLKKASDANDMITPESLNRTIDTVGNLNQTSTGRGDQALYQLARDGMRVLTAPKHGEVSKLLLAQLAMGGVGGGLEGGLHLRDEQGHINVGGIARGAGLGLAAPWALRMATKNPNLFRAIGTGAARGIGPTTAGVGQSVTAPSGSNQEEPP